MDSRISGVGEGLTSRYVSFQYLIGFPADSTAQAAVGKNLSHFHYNRERDFLNTS
jgi:hypothetical protein